MVGVEHAQARLGGPAEVLQQPLHRAASGLHYASDQGGQHRPAWAAFNRRVRGSEGAVGIWHETYVVPAGSYESIYIDIPPAGLGEAWGVEPVSRRGERAAQRLESGAGRRR
ncbi:monooxygenase family protein [Streptomyces olivaceus]|uniref:monooxygenase family protein n=1 Tax=Streptomyces olivaceus TaxID=47716 RepID=UPI003694B01D